MFLDTDPAVRDVFTDLHIRSIVACGGLKESIQELKRDVMLTVYGVKDRREVTDEVLADLTPSESATDGSECWGTPNQLPSRYRTDDACSCSYNKRTSGATTQDIMSALREGGEYASRREPRDF